MTGLGSGLSGPPWRGDGALESTLETYNESCSKGEDAAFFKPSPALLPVETPPFYAAEIRPAIVVLTSTGLRIDSEARVIDEGERPIPGLFASGETTGGVLGPRYVGSGNSILNAIVFGRVAGANAAACAARSD